MKCYRNTIIKASDFDYYFLSVYWRLIKTGCGINMRISYIICARKFGNESVGIIEIYEV